MIRRGPIHRGLALSLFAWLGACATQPMDRVPLPPPPPTGEPANFIGLSEASMRTSYGPPAFIRKEGSIQMWRYAGAGCQAFFFLYPTRGALTVQHVETSPHPNNSAADISCLQSLHAVPQPVS
jgi:hypothetical protein